MAALPMMILLATALDTWSAVVVCMSSHESDEMRLFQQAVKKQADPRYGLLGLSFSAHSRPCGRFASCLIELRIFVPDEGRL